MLIKNNLTYCSNIFKEKNLKNLLKKIDKYIKLLNCRNIKLSLCLSNKLVNEIKFNNNLNFLKNWIKERNAHIASINGFVYRSFHKKNIKENIYYPDWTSKKRLIFTEHLINLLDCLIKKNENGSISTSPLSYSLWIKYRYRDYIFFKSAKNLTYIVKKLLNIKSFIHLDIEPEPGCLINNFKSFISFYKKWLLLITPYFFKKKHNISFVRSIKYIKKHIQLCYDICHFSVNFERPKNILKILKKNNLNIGKIQISSALEIKIPKKNTRKTNILKNLLYLLKSPFLHQTIEKKQKKFIKHIDFCDAIKNFKNKEKSILRVHCHVPLYRKKIKHIKTTNMETKKTLKILLKNKKIKHIEIETYAYDIISKKNKFDSMLKEYKWVKNIILNNHVNSKTNI